MWAFCGFFMTDFIRKFAQYRYVLISFWITWFLFMSLAALRVAVSIPDCWRQFMVRRKRSRLVRRFSLCAYFFTTFSLYVLGFLLATIFLRFFACEGIFCPMRCRKAFMNMSCWEKFPVGWLPGYLWVDWSSSVLWKTKARRSHYNFHISKGSYRNEKM